MVAVSLGISLALRIAGDRRGRVLQFLPIIDLAIIAYVSKRLAVLYLGYTLVTFALTAILLRAKRARKFLFAFFCILCLVPLLYFRTAAVFTDLPTAGITLVGMAYNMLKAIDALFFVYYSEEKIPFVDYCGYLLYFPVFTAGPVFRWREYDKAFHHSELPDARCITIGTKRIIWGLFKKVVLSAAATELLQALMAHTLHWYISLVLPIISAFVLYFDMSGYADIAIGMGKWMGITVPENFRHVLESPSWTQFWHHWHITVSDWIREHMYVLVYGKKLTRRDNAILSFIVMILLSLWHGFSWPYLIEGVALGTIMAFENLLGLTVVNKRKVKKSYYIFRCAVVMYMFSLDCLLYSLSLADVAKVLKGFLSL